MKSSFSSSISTVAVVVSTPPPKPIPSLKRTAKGPENRYQTISSSSSLGVNLGLFSGSKLLFVSGRLNYQLVFFPSNPQLQPPNKSPYINVSIQPSLEPIFLVVPPSPSTPTNQLWSLFTSKELKAVLSLRCSYLVAFDPFFWVPLDWKFVENVCRFKVFKGVTRWWQQKGCWTFQEVVFVEMESFKTGNENIYVYVCIYIYICMYVWCWLMWRYT